MQSPVPTIQDLQALREENSLLRTRYTEATKLMLHRCPLEAPPKYDDKKEGFTTFKAQCELYINLHLPDFPNKKMKVGFLINQLTVAPARWATARLITQDPILNDANLLLNALGNFLWNEEALMVQYHEDLREEVLDDLSRTSMPKNLQELMTLTIQIDA
uniref:DUF4939 domain-containing protein n=1 Tax=Varanus komodoensis TaxID=61221 RepID=A0A8D2KWU7_VARKO